MSPKSTTSEEPTVVEDVESGSKVVEPKTSAGSTTTNNNPGAVRRYLLCVTIPILLVIIIVALVSNRPVMSRLPLPLTDAPTSSPTTPSQLGDPNSNVTSEGLDPAISPTNNTLLVDSNGATVLSDNTDLSIWGFSGYQNSATNMGASGTWQSGPYAFGEGPWFVSNSTGFFSSQFNPLWDDADIEFTKIYHYGADGETKNVCFEKSSQGEGEDALVVYTEGTIFDTPLAAELLKMIEEKLNENNPNADKIQIGE